MRLPEIGIPFMTTARLRCVILREATEHDWSLSGVSP